jgi:hypothetical protein
MGRYIRDPTRRARIITCICSTTMRADNRIWRPYSRSWESRTRRGVKLDAIPSAHDHIAMYKRMGMDFPIDFDFSINLVRKQLFRALGVHCRRPCPLTFI